MEFTFTSNENTKQIKENSHRGPSYQAYLILHCLQFVLLIAGIDKFFYFLTNWEQYLAPPFNIFGHSYTTMQVVGVFEIIAGIGVWLKPKIFAYVISLWLLGIIINLLFLGNFYDIVLRDLGLLLASLALARLSLEYS